jgi:hypothetical protein
MFKRIEKSLDNGQESASPSSPGSWFSGWCFWYFLTSLVLTAQRISGSWCPGPQSQASPLQMPPIHLCPHSFFGCYECSLRPCLGAGWCSLGLWFLSPFTAEASAHFLSSAAATPTPPALASMTSPLFLPRMRNRQGWRLPHDRILQTADFVTARA